MCLCCSQRCSIGRSAIGPSAMAMLQFDRALAALSLQRSAGLFPDKENA
jgi:hypothetical protein